MGRVSVLIWDRSGEVEKVAGADGAHLEAVGGLVGLQHQQPGLFERINVAVFDQHAPSVQRLCSKHSRAALIPVLFHD